MNRERYQRLQEAFNRLCDVAPEKRAPLIGSDGDDDEFRRELDLLLTHHDSSSGFLGHPGEGARLLALGLHDAGDLTVHEVHTALNRALPEAIGRYRIIRLLGEGGMGVVYEAEQAETRRRVALKVMRVNGFLPAAQRRFRREAQLLGQLRHPGIAQVLEAGVIDGEQGELPFIAMDLITGRPLLDYCAANALGTSARLDLMARICDALQHAHDHGVIHRDLKPANILVESSDGQPKILDFGVARAMDCDPQAVTLQTQVGQIIGTIPYMSPEQVSGETQQLDVRSDVYSVGVILYELLVGRLPYDLQGRSIPELARIIREVDPVGLGSIDRRLRGDIDAIVCKALEKERERRYSSASELAADIRRHLSDQPIEARPQTAVYRVRKFVKRRRSLVATAAGAAMLMSGTVGVALATRGNAITPATELLSRVASGSASPNVHWFRSAAEWLDANPGAESYAFDQFFAGSVTTRVDLAGIGVPVALPLAGGTMTVSSFGEDGTPTSAVVDSDQQYQASDAPIDGPGGRLVLTFDPPILAFYGMYASVAEGSSVSAELFSGDRPIGFAGGAVSTHNTRAQGFGLTCAAPFDRIVFSASERGSVLLGAIRLLQTPKGGLGTVTMPGYGGENGDKVYLDFACVFEKRGLSDTKPLHELRDGR